MQDLQRAAEAREASLGQEKGQLKTALAGALEQKASLEASVSAVQEENLHLQAQVIGLSMPAVGPWQAPNCQGCRDHACQSRCCAWEQLRLWVTSSRLRLVGTGKGASLKAPEDRCSWHQSL